MASAHVAPVRPRWIAAVAGVLGLAVTCLLAAWQAHTNQLDAAARFATSGRRIVDRLNARMASYEYGLRSARGMVMAAGPGPIDEQRHGEFWADRDLRREFPGVRGFGLLRRVPATSEASFIAATRSAGRPDFAIRQLAPHDGDRYVIELLQPTVHGEPTVGLDIASEPSWRAAAEQAARTGAPTTTAPVLRALDSGAADRSFLLLLPIYPRGASTITPEQRADAVTGWALAVTSIDEMLQDLDDASAQYVIALRDLALPDDEASYRSPAREPVTSLRATMTIPMYGRTWQVELRATPAFTRQLGHRDPRTVAVCGFALSAWLATRALLLASRHARRRRQRLEQARRAAIVEGSADAILSEAHDGTVTDWNAAAERLFGYPAAFALGRPAASLILPPGRESEDVSIRATIARGEWVAPFDTTRMLRDGTLAEVSVTASPIYGPDGECVGLSKTVRDISEARRAQRALAALNATLEQQVEDRTARLDAALHDLYNVVDALPSMIGYWDKGLVNRLANKAYAGWFGIAPREMHGRAMRELLGEEAFDGVRHHIEKVFRGEALSYERAISVPGTTSLRYLLVHFVPDVVDDEVRGFYVLVHDITELTEQRNELAVAQRHNQALLQTIHQHAIVSVTDRTGRIIEISENFCRISGYEREELIGKNHGIVNSRHHDRAFWISMWRQIASGRAWRGEICNRAKDGSLYWVDSIISPFFGPDGKIDRYISIRTDVTARKRAEAEVLATSSLLKAVLAAASEVSIIATNIDGEITLFNRGAERLLGYREAEMVGRSTVSQLHLDAEIEAHAAELNAEHSTRVEGFPMFAHDGPITREWTYVRKDGTRVPVSLTTSEMRDHEGRLFGYLGVAHDVSQQKQQERSLRDAVHKAKQANAAKSQFLANMSHEIRTPMNAVIGLSYLLERTVLTPDQAGLLAKIMLASKSLLSIINDVLDLSKIEAGELKLERAPFQLGTLLYELSALMTVQADAKGIELTVDAPGDLPLTVEGDSTRLYQILSNLLSNAIKFTERGNVWLTVQRMLLGVDRVRLRFIVKDTGVGIAPDALDRLFQPFAQADTSTTRRFGGTGLGLSIVKQLVSLMGGELGVRSTPGVGSEFHVELELGVCGDVTQAMPQAMNAPAAGPGLTGVRVLVADDSVINLEVARRILELEGAVVRLAGNGQEAVDALLAYPDDCDVVLMDIHMPLLDGYDATRRIRSGLGLVDLPVIALTAGTLTRDQRHAESAGVNDFVSKPFEPQLLVQCIRRHVKVVDRAPPPSPQPALAPWPAIEGIDAADSCRRFAGDARLFAAMLSRLLADHADLDAGVAAEPGGLDQLASRLHTLKGSAGTLGATEIYRLAVDAERACRGHHTAEAAQVITALTAALARLRQHAAHPLEAATLARAVVDDTGAALDPAALTALRDLLNHADLDALPRFTALSPQLQHALDHDAYAALQRHIENLEFVEAADALGALL